MQGGGGICTRILYLQGVSQGTASSQACTKAKNAMHSGPNVTCHVYLMRSDA